jgi:protein TonB
MTNHATNLNSEFIVVANRDNPTAISKVGKEGRSKLNIEDLKKQIRELGAEIRQRELGSDQTIIKFANSINKHKYLVMQYTADVTERINRIGNQNFPKEALYEALNKAQSIRINIGIKRDGNIYGVYIIRSSGNTRLDEAANRIVRMSAPFAPIPLDVVKELDLDVLVITRELKFADEKTGMTSN